MPDISAPAPAPARRRLSPAAAGSLVLGGVLALTWLPLSLLMVTSGIGGLMALGSGVLLLVPWLMLMQLAVRLERRRVVAVHGIDVIVPSRRRSTRTGLGGWLHGLWLEVSSAWYWRGVLHHHLALLLAGVFTLAALLVAGLGWGLLDAALRASSPTPLTLGSLEVPRWMLLGAGVLAMLLAVGMLLLGVLADRALARTMISGSEDELRGQVAELSVRRQGAVDAAAQERLRIERDLHDGVQPRLVALAMTLGMAKGAIRTDPDRAAEMVSEAHAEAKSVMADLRQLARGIHPAVLTDRGLDAALSALAARSTIPVDLQVQLHAPLDREREAVAYFVVAEALTNIAKHSGAQQAGVEVRQGPRELEVRVRDDGRGGAQVRRDGVSTGLAGLSDRVRSTGGHLEVSSPPDGGTELLAVIPLTAPAAVPTTEETLR